MTARQAREARRQTTSKATDVYCATVGLVAALIMLPWAVRAHGAVRLIDWLFIAADLVLGAWLLVRPARPVPARRRR
jgi:hypothetical protein